MLSPASTSGCAPRPSAPGDARADATEACAALWAEGELVALDDLVLHDAGMDVRTPSHALVRAQQYLRLRRQAATGDPEFLLTPAGILRLLGRPPRSPENRAGEALATTQMLGGHVFEAGLAAAAVPLRSQARTLWTPIL